MQKRPFYKRYARYRLELFSALGVTLWGSFLVNPFVNNFAITNSYAEMAKHATENEWGTGAVIIGLISLIGIMFQEKSLRRAGMLGVLAFRTFTLILVGAQNHFLNTGTGDFFLWALMALVAYVRIDHEF